MPRGRNKSEGLTNFTSFPLLEEKWVGSASGSAIQTTVE